jgi:hypothetical protein
MMDEMRKRHREMYLHEACFLVIDAKTLPATIDAILPDHTMRISTGSTVTGTIPPENKFSYSGTPKSEDKYVLKTSKTKNIVPVISSACMQTDVRFSTEIIITTNDWHSRSHIHKQTDLQEKRTSMCQYCVPSNCTTFQSI